MVDTKELKSRLIPSPVRCLEVSLILSGACEWQSYEGASIFIDPGCFITILGKYMYMYMGMHIIYYIHSNSKHLDSLVIPGSITV